MTKTPFELRAEALTEARVILTDEFNAKRNIACDLYSVNARESAKLLRELSFPSGEAIMKLAKTFDKFIAGKDTV